MNRRDLLQASKAFGLAAALPGAAMAEPSPESQLDAGAAQPAAAPNPLRPPAEGSIPVAFLISDGAVLIDFAGPWEVFGHVHIPGRAATAFHLYTVAETTRPVRASGGMTIVPNHSLASAPTPRIIVIPAQSAPSAAVVAWLRDTSRTTDVTMSVCTGVFVLARTGLLSGKTATTHHSAYTELAMAFPDSQVKRGARFVETGNLASAGGLSSGIDLALRVVERYFGRAVALGTADNLEYQGLGWMNPDSNAAYATARVSTDQHPLCPVCEMDVDPPTAPRSLHQGRTYYFCIQTHKEQFDAAPGRYLHVRREMR